MRRSQNARQCEAETGEASSVRFRCWSGRTDDAVPDEARTMKAQRPYRLEVRDARGPWIRLSETWAHERGVYKLMRAYRAKGYFCRIIDTRARTP